MDPLIVLIGVFVFFAIYHNKDISETEKGKDTYTWFAIFIVFMVFGGLGFLLTTPTSTNVGYAFLIPAYIAFATIGTCTKGYPQVLSFICAIAVVVYIIMGSFA